MDKDAQLKLEELKNAVYFMAEQVEKNREYTKEALKEMEHKIARIDSDNIQKITREYQRKTDLLVSTMATLIGKLEHTESKLHSQEKTELAKIDHALIAILKQIRDNQQLSADALSNLAKYTAKQNKLIQALKTRKGKR